MLARWGEPNAFPGVGLLNILLFLFLFFFFVVVASFCFGTSFLVLHLNE
jgi:hypothetical protein